MSPYFWQRIVSPHMAGLASALAQKGRNVVYVAERPLSQERAAQGWEPQARRCRTILTPTESAVRDVVKGAPEDSIHLCQGVRSNGFVGTAQQELAKRQLRQWVVMEMVDDSGWRGALKRIEYARLFRARRRVLQGVLATGWRTREWVVARGMPLDRVFPFAYFLQSSVVEERSSQGADEPFRFLFVGQLIALLGGVIQRARWRLLASWLVSGYVTPQFFLLTGIVVGLSQSLFKGYEKELGRLTRTWSGA